MDDFDTLLPHYERELALLRQGMERFEREFPKAAAQLSLEVLQGLIYDDPDFLFWLGLQRGALASSDDTALNDSMNAMKYGLSDGSEMSAAPIVRALMPSLQLVLTSDYKTSDIEYRSDAPDRLVLQDYQKRMEWITNAAKKYHGLMQKKRTIMLNHLKIIQGWDETPDR